MRFWDSSAILPLCLDEPSSAEAKSILEEDENIAVWWGTIVECHSALARLVRDGVLNALDAEAASAILKTLQERWSEVEPTNEVRKQATRLLRIHPLKAADSVQLAAALVMAGLSPNGHPFVSLDQRLREAARKEGFHLLPAGY
ncbi:MAG: type II toxin-antitoxin system VapC family toxin [Candidatus Aquicultorales bacterium]